MNSLAILDFWEGIDARRDKARVVVRGAIIMCVCVCVCVCVGACMYLHVCVQVNLHKLAVCLLYVCTRTCRQNYIVHTQYRESNR